MREGDLNNDYARLLARIIDDIPKSVLAAIAVSALTQGGDFIEHAAQRVAAEWVILHSNGIVPQRPPAKVRDIAKLAESDQP